MRRGGRSFETHLMNSLVHGSATQGRDESDAELLERVKSGDTKAFGRIYDRHCQAAYGLARRYCRAPTEAEEVVQDAFLSVWRYAHRFDPARGSGRTWILGIVANRAV